MISFHLLGTVDLRGPAGRQIGSPLSGAKRLALLAYLALGARRGFTRRDTLLGLFWPESSESQARNALSNMLHQIRQALGPELLVARGRDEIGLAEGLLWCDAVAFQRAMDEGRLAEALELYRGDLLEGLFVSEASPEFDQWMDGERSRLRSRAGEAAVVLVEQAERAGDDARAIRWARRAIALDPYDEREARRLMLLLDGAGDRAGALRTYEELAARLAREFDAEPSAETQSVIAGVRARRKASIAADPASDGAAESSTRGYADSGPAAVGERTEDAPVHFIAVLPFENLSGTPDAEPFAAGLHDDLLTELSRISALRVIARTSVLRYRGTRKTAPEIARELGVGTIVEAGLQTAGGRLRLNVQVIDARSGAHRWAERYDRELSARSIFDLQGELAHEIANALQAELTAGEQRRAAGREHTEDLEAYRLTVHGRALLAQRTPGAMYRSVEYFERAVARDPGFALAWSGLADALSLLEFYEQTPPAAAPGAVQAALRAVELGPELGQAHASLGIIRSIRQEGALALADLETAIRLGPSNAEAHAWLGWVHLLRGYPTEALAAERRAVDLDPLAPAFRVYLAEAWLANGDAPAALREAVRAREIQPEYGLAHFMEGLSLFHLGRMPEAEAAMVAALGLVPSWGTPCHAEIHAVVVLVRAATGDVVGARARLAQIDGAAHPFSRGLALASLGDLDGAFSAFERVEHWRSFSADHLRYFFPEVLGPLRTDSRYARMLRGADRAWGVAAG